MITKLDYDRDDFLLRFYIDETSPSGLSSSRKTSKKNVGESVGFIMEDSDGYERWMVRIGQRSYIASRIILTLFDKNDPDKYVDHKDGNSLNNKVENLRYVTENQSAQNRKVKTTNNSGVSGVYFRRKRNHTYVIADWIDHLTSKRVEKLFAVNKYGILPAFKMAYLARQQATVVNNGNGAVYKEGSLSG